MAYSTRNAVWFILLSCSCARAESFWSWHTFDLVALKQAGWEVTVHSRLRTREGELQQGRTGAILRREAAPRLALLSGYYYGKEEDSVDEFRDVHRMFGGGEITLLRRETVKVAGRTLVEYFFRDTRPDSGRFRQRLRLEQGRAVGPAVQGEWFFDRDGFLSQRYHAGVRWKMNGWATLEAGYLYDRRRASIGLNRHALVTSVAIDPW